MNILFDIGHPAHVHLFKNVIFSLKKKGHNVLVTARDKDVTIDLLNGYNIKYKVLTSIGRGKAGLFKEWIVRDYKLFQTARIFNPDLLVGVLNPAIAHVSWLLRKKSIIFNDTEPAFLAQKITYPFADVICTPMVFNKNIGQKQIRYNGYHELAYLHPKYFTPNPSALNDLKLTENDQYIILRFISWRASHDVGQHGINNKKELAKMLEKYGKVFITSEEELDPELEKYKLKISPEKLHDLLYYATLYIGEGATTASECAVLGTHAIYVNTLRLGYTDEEEEKYGLVYNFSNNEDIEKKVFEKAVDLLNNPNLKQEGKLKREKLIKDKIDVTGFMVQFIEHYK